MSKSICIVVSDYYKKISNGLELGAIKFCDQKSIIYEKFYVPGALEIGPAIKFISESKHNFDGFVALGCVIKGQTPHFDLLCSSLFNSILSLSIKYNKPIGNGVITALNLKQAKQRSKKNSNKQNKGSEAANAVISILKNGPKKI